MSCDLALYLMATLAAISMSSIAAGSGLNDDSTAPTRRIERPLLMDVVGQLPKAIKKSPHPHAMPVVKSSSVSERATNARAIVLGHRSTVQLRTSRRTTPIQKQHAAKKTQAGVRPASHVTPTSRSAFKSNGAPDSRRSATVAHVESAGEAMLAEPSVVYPSHPVAPPVSHSTMLPVERSPGLLNRLTRLIFGGAVSTGVNRVHKRDENLKRFIDLDGDNVIDAYRTRRAGREVLRDINEFSGQPRVTSSPSRSALSAPVP